MASAVVERTSSARTVAGADRWAAGLIGIVAVLVLMAFDSDQREAITLSTISAVIIVAIGVWMQKRHGDRGYDAPDEAKAAAPGAPGPKR